MKSAVDTIDPQSLRAREMMFVHSRLDDCGLEAAPFRVYGHLVRRASQSGKAWPSIKSMSRVCRLHPKTIRSALKTLRNRRMIGVEPRAGETTVYTLLPPSQWLPSVHKQNDQHQTDTTVSDGEGHHPKTITTHPCQLESVKGNPSEGNPNKVIQVPHSPPKGDGEKDTGFTSSLEEEIYTAYPKKVGKPTALRAIRRALSKCSFDLLLERTRLYAQTCNSPDQFIPNPATWFNQERFNDDPATWRRAPGSGGKPQPAIIRSDKFVIGESSL